MTKSERFELRIDGDLREWLLAYAKSENMTASQVVHRLLEALREQQLSVVPRGPCPFPGNELPPGDTPEYPVLVAPSTRDQIGEPVRGWYMEEIQGVGIYNTLNPSGEIATGDISEDKEPGGKS